MSLKGHAALAAVILSAALTAARLLAISRFDINTAASILQISGTGAAVAGTALTLLPFALVLAVCFLAVVVFIDQCLLDWSAWATSTTMWVAIGAVLCLTAITLFALTLIFVVATMAVGRYLRRHHQRTDIVAEVRRSGLLRAQGTLLLAALVLGPIIVQRPWLPEQALVETNGTTRVGYLLGDSDGRLAIMSDANRTVSFVEEDQIQLRYICASTARAGGLLRNVGQVRFSGSVVGAVLWGDQTPRYPKCPNPS